MFKSIRENWTEINEILEERGELSKISGLGLHALDEIFLFLKHFDDATIQLHYTNKPSLYLCFPYVYRLIQICQINSSDSDLLKHIKKLIEQNLRNKWLPLN